MLSTRPKSEYQAPLCGAVALTPEAAMLGGGSPLGSTTKDITYEDL